MPHESDAQDKTFLAETARLAASSLASPLDRAGAAPTNTLLRFKYVQKTNFFKEKMFLKKADIKLAKNVATITSRTLPWRMNCYVSYQHMVQTRCGGTAMAHGHPEAHGHPRTRHEALWDTSGLSCGCSGAFAPGGTGLTIPLLQTSLGRANELMGLLRCSSSTLTST